MVHKDDVETVEVQKHEISVKEDRIVVSSKDKTSSEVVRKEETELTEEELETAMEVLSATALELMQKIADTFGISMEELQMAMNELDMSANDMLDAAKLGALILQLGGAADSYALVTDEALYDKYRMLLDEQAKSLENIAEELGVDADELRKMIDSKMHDENKPVSIEFESPENAVTKSSDMNAVSTAGDIADNETDAQSRFGDSHESGMDDASQKQGNVELVFQNVSQEGVQSEIQHVESIYDGRTWEMDTQDIMRQIMDYMKLQIDAETTSLEMQLHPASLGTVRVNIASNGGVVTANFIAQNEAVKAALESQMVQLKENFEQQGVKVESIEVTVQTHQFEQNLEQGRGREDGSSSTKKNRTRRINLNDPIAMESMEEEDTLVAEMLAAGGSTVDYTA